MRAGGLAAVTAESGRCQGDVSARFRALEARVAVLEADVAALQRSRSTLSRADRDALDAILPAIVGELGSAVFLVAELTRHESAGLRLVLRGWSARRLGRLFRRAAGQPIGGLVIEAMGEEGHARLWRVVGLAEFSGTENPGAASFPRCGGPSSRT